MPMYGKRAKCRCGLFISKDGMCKKCSNNVSITPASNVNNNYDENTISISNQQTNQVVDRFNDTLASIDLHNITSCDGCKRSNVELTSISNLQNFYCHKSFAFDSKVLKRSNINLSLCAICMRYSQLKFVKNNKWWCLAWPSVLYTNMFKNKSSNSIIAIWKCLPKTLRLQWEHCTYSLEENIRTQFQTDCIFFDQTNNIQEYNNLIKSYDLKNLELALDKYAFRSVKCPWGCHEHIENVGYIPFNHFLPCIDNSFQSCNSNFDEFFTGIREDFLETSYKLLDKIPVLPSVAINDELGLCLLTCKNHKKGSSLEYVHLPKNEALGTTPSPFSDRFGSAVIHPHILHPGKIGQSSNSYKLLEERGGSTGVSSFSLSTEPKLDNKKSLLMWKSEHLIAKNRPDCVLNQGEEVQEYIENLKSDTISSIRSVKTDEEKVKNCLEPASFIPLVDAVNVSVNQTKAEISVDARVLQGDNPPQNNNENRLKLNFPVQSLSLFLHSGFGKIPFAIKNLPKFSLVFFIHSFIFCFYLNEIIHMDQNQINALDSWVHCMLIYIYSISKLRSRLCRIPNISARQLRNRLETHAFNSTRNLNAFRNFGYLLSGLPCVYVAEMQRSQYIENEICNVDLNSKYFCLYNNDSDSTSRHSQPLKTTLTINESEFKLVSIACNASFYTRKLIKYHGDYVTKFHCIDSNSVRFKRCHFDVISKCRNNWKILIYQQREHINFEKIYNDYFSYIGGQTKIKCRVHKSFLTRSSKNTSKVCAWDNELNTQFNSNNSLRKCTRVPNLSCPNIQCQAHLCKFHSNLICDKIASEEYAFIPPTANVGRVTQINTANVPEQSEIIDNRNIHTDEFLTFGGIIDSPDEDEDEEPIQSNAGAPPVFEKTTDDGKYIGGHYLLNHNLALFTMKRRKFDPTVKTKRFFQNIVSKNLGQSIPLVYPEAMLFPSIFYNMEPDGSITGAIPKPLWTANNKELGFASLSEMLKCRLANGELLTSTDPRYIQFAFDSLFNLNMEHTTPKIVLRRGFDEITQGKNVADVGAQEASLPFDLVDARRSVHELSNLIAQQEPTFFLTLTCNQKSHPGVRQIYKAQQDYISKIKSREFFWENNFNNEDEKMIIQSNMTEITLAWERASRHFMNYLEKSSEKPLGNVTKVWYRYEFQDSQGNLPHIHALVWTKDGKNSDQVKNAVCGNSGDLLKWGKLFEQSGFLAPPYEGKYDINKYEDNMRFQLHSCENAKFRCCKKTGKFGDKVCRVPHYGKFPFNYRFEQIDVEHDQETKDILQKCNLYQHEYYEESSMHFDKYHESLIAGKYYYPASKREHFSPCNPYVFLFTQSSSNIRVCDRYFTSRYLAKYAAGEEERAQVRFKASGECGVEVENEGIKNIKITGVKIAESCKSDSRPKGRSLCLTECIWWSFNLPYVCKNTEFVHISTSPLECRPSRIFKNFDRNNDRNGYIAQNEKSEGCRIREDVLNLEQWRCFTDSQKLIMSDRSKYNYTVDTITQFGLRPPELLLVSKIGHYFSWFIRETCPLKRLHGQNISRHERFLNAEYHLSSWVDGLGHVIKLRSDAIGDFLTLVNNCCDCPSKRNLVNVLSNFEDPEIYDRFVSKITSTKAVPVYSLVSPLNHSRFLIHILLSMGSFVTELDLFRSGSLAAAFETSGLINVLNKEKSVHELLTSYILEQLMFIPGGTKNFDRYLKSAYAILMNCILNNEIIFDETPPVLLRSIHDEAQTKVITILNDRREAITDVLIAQGEIYNLPSKQDLLNDLAVNWVPEIKQSPVQSNESYSEQCNALNILIESIDSFRFGQSSFTHGKLLVGPPGTGKTHILKSALAYCISRNINTIITSVAAEKSIEFGGCHLHLLLPLTVIEKHGLLSVHVLAEQTLSRLLFDPIRLAVLQRIEVIFIEEFGLIDASLYEVINLVFQGIKQNKCPWGGILVIGTGDHKQLPPVQGLPIWTSPLLITNFHVLKLQHYVRSATDETLQQCLDILRNISINDKDLDFICQSLRSCCKFVRSWNDIADCSILRVFGKRAAECEAIEKYQHNVKSTLSESEYFMSTALDEISNDNGLTWLTSTKFYSKLINRHVLEPESLLIHVKGVMRATYNDPSRRWSQGQLCVIQAFNVIEKSVTVRFAPAGTRTVTPDIIDNSPNIILRPMLSRKQYLTGKFIGRRMQYPLKHFTAATIHKILGDTIPQIATQVSLNICKYRLWLKQQVLVVLSRVQRLEHITFVGSIEDTITAIRDLAKRHSHWDVYMDEVMANISRSSLANIDAASQIVHQNYHVFNPFHRALPTQLSGYVYLLISTKYTSTTYIGQTKNLRRRLNEHNSGNGADFTRPMHRRPWGMYAYVTGFEGSADDDINLSQRKTFELKWQYDVAVKQPVNVNDVVNIAIDLISNWQPSALTMVICGEVTDAHRISSSARPARP